MDLSRCDFLRKTFRYRSSSRNDDRSCLHYSGSRRGAILGSNANGDSFRQHSLDQTADVLDSTMARKTADGRLGDSLDVVFENRRRRGGLMGHHGLGSGKPVSGQVGFGS